MMIVVEDTVAEGDKVAARCSVRAKHEGDFLGKAASQSPVEFTGMTIVRIANGKIVEAWNNFDFMTLHKQVGLLS
jgi:predicted ester cyclase